MMLSSVSCVTSTVAMHLPAESSISLLTLDIYLNNVSVTPTAREQQTGLHKRVRHHA